MSKGKRYTEEQKQAIIERVDKWRDKGYNQAAACEKVGIATGSYSTWKNYGVEPGSFSRKSEGASVEFHQSEESSTPKRKYNKKQKSVTGEKVFAFYGSPQDVLKIMESING